MQLEPWKPHARRLRGAGRSWSHTAETLTEFYGFTISVQNCRTWCREMRANKVAALSCVSLKNQKNDIRETHDNDLDQSQVTGAARDHRDDDAERWLARNDPSYAERRRSWQQPRTDAIARQSDYGLAAGASDADE